MFVVVIPEKPSFADPCGWRDARSHLPIRPRMTRRKKLGFKNVKNYYLKLLNMGYH